MSLKFSSINTYCKNIENKIKLNKINYSLNSIASKISHITTDPSCTSVAYGSERIDQLCNIIGEKNLKKNNITINNNFEKKDINYYIATKVLNSGGHSKIIGNLINAKPNEKHCILLTGIRGKSDVDFFEKEICENNKNLKVLKVPHNRFDKKLTWIQKHLSKENPKKVYVFNDHNDSVAISSLSKSMNLACYFYHHADHKFCLGVFSNHFHHVHLNNYIYNNYKDVFNKNNYYVPCSAKDFGFKNVSENNNDKLITCSVGGRNKIEEDYSYDYLKTIIKVLKITEGKHIHIGKLSPLGFLKINYLLLINNIDFKKFIYYKWTESVWKKFHDEKVDLFIAPFPIVGGLTLIEALGSGTPIACHKNLYFRNLSGVDIINKESFFWENDTELFNFVKNVSRKTLIDMSSQGRDFYVKYYSQDNFIACLNEDKSCNIPSLQDVPYNINRDDYAFYIESRLSIKNYLKRIIHRLLSYIISRI